MKSYFLQAITIANYALAALLAMVFILSGMFVAKTILEAISNVSRNYHDEMEM